MTEIKQLRQIKRRRGISMETMAREIGVSSRTIFRWFHGQDFPSLMAQQRLAEYIKEQKAAEIQEKIRAEVRG